MNRSNLVTTRSGLTIGCAYIAPPPRQSDDADTIQTVLLTRRDGWNRFEGCLNFIDRWAVAAYVLMFAFGVGFWLVARWWR